MLSSTKVGIGDKDIARLSVFYKRAYKKILGEIKDSTDFGIYNRRQILSQIEDILKGLGTNVQRFIDYEIPHNYKVGADQAVRQIKTYGFTVIADQGFNRLHQQAINALLSDTSKAIGASLTGVKRSAETLFSDAVKEEVKLRLAEGIVSGDPTKATKKYVLGALQEDGLGALVDKGGRTWQLDTYTEMLIRTKSVEARNTGLVNRALENGFDLVQVSSHGSSCALCQPWEGKILSITGETEGYDTLDQAESDGLFHPNCQHGINTIDPEIASRTRGFNEETGKYELDTSTK